MVFYLSVEETREISKSPNFGAFIDNLMLCYREGKHIVVINPHAIRFMLKECTISDSCSATLKYYYSRYSVHNSILDKVDKVINITLDCSGKSKVTKGYVDVPFNQLIDSSNIQKTVMLVENRSDATMYDLLLKYYVHTSGMMGFKFSYDARTGGGDTIKDEYKALLDMNEIFCLCILDRDKRNPSVEMFGNTAKGVINVANIARTTPHLYGKCDYLVLPVLEAENLIPINFFKEAYELKNYKISISNLSIYETSFPNARRYVDYKKDTLSDCRFWSRFSCMNNVELILENEKEILFKSYGSTLLKKFCELSFDSIKSLLSADRTIEQIWLRIGRFCFSHFVGTGPVNTVV